MRGSNMPGRFSINDEIDNIRDGMHQDLQMPVGQTVNWWQYDAASTSSDALYDVASSDSPEGRYYRRPIEIPCLTAVIYQGQTHHDDRGFYNIDRLHLTIDMSVVWRLIPSLPNGSDDHLKDRVVFRGGVYQPFQVWSRGQVSDTYTVLSVDCNQVKTDEVVNDPQFAADLEGASFAPGDPGLYDPFPE